MKLTALELRTLTFDASGRIQRKRQDAHGFATQLVHENQDDRCTVDEDVALRLMLELRDYALTKEDATEHFGMTLIGEDELLMLCVSKEPNAEGRYEVTTCIESLAEYQTR